MPPRPHRPSRGDLTRDEFSKIRQWRKKGWPISAIARHLQRSPTTIKTYLSGDRVPGPRARRADTFIAFASYSRRRFDDDPHLNTKVLFPEVADLGYPGSYKSFCRALRRHRLRPGCPPCQMPARLDAPPPPAGHSQHPQPLPMAVSPVAGEMLVSYLGRLATANHVTIGDLLTILPPWFHTKISNHDDRAQHHMLVPATTDALHRLAVITGTTPTALALALPAFANGDLLAPVRATRACQRCMVTRGIHQAVPVHLPACQQICTRHGLWLGAADRPQLDLTTCPEIIAAQHRARRLLRRCTPQQLIFAQLAATRHITGQASRDTSASIPPATDWRRRARLLKDSNRHLDIPATRDELASAAIYPGAIALAVAALVPAPASARKFGQDQLRKPGQ